MTSLCSSFFLYQLSLWHCLYLLLSTICCWTLCCGTAADAAERRHLLYSAGVPADSTPCSNRLIDISCPRGAEKHTRRCCSQWTGQTARFDHFVDPASHNMWAVSASDVATTDCCVCCRLFAGRAWHIWSVDGIRGRHDSRRCLLTTASSSAWHRWKACAELMLLQCSNSCQKFL